MLAAGRLHPRVGSVAAQMRFADRRDVLNSAGLELDRLGVAADRLVGTPRRGPAPERALRGVRRHRRRRALPQGDARPGGRLRRDLLRLLRGRRPRLARPGARLARAVRARGRSSTTTTRRPPSTARRRSSTWSAATGCGRSPRTRPAGCCCSTRPGCSPTTPPTSSTRRSTAAALAPLRGRVARAARVARLPPQRRARTAARCTLRRPLGFRRALQRHAAGHRSTRAHEAEQRADRRAALAMRSAIVHDWFQGFHGAERTVAAMLDLFAPDPDIFTFQAARELLPDAPRPRDRARVAPRAAARACASAGTTRAAGAGCCRTCRATSSGST